MIVWKKSKIFQNTGKHSGSISFPVGNHASNGNHFLGSHCTGSSTPSYPRLDVSLSLMGRHFGGHACPRQLPTVTDSEEPGAKRGARGGAQSAGKKHHVLHQVFHCRQLSVNVGNCRGCACPPKWRPISLRDTSSHG